MIYPYILLSFIVLYRIVLKKNVLYHCFNALSYDIFLEMVSCNYFSKVSFNRQLFNSEGQGQMLSQLRG